MDSGSYSRLFFPPWFWVVVLILATLGAMAVFVGCIAALFWIGSHMRFV